MVYKKWLSLAITVIGGMATIAGVAQYRLAEKSGYSNALAGDERPWRLVNPAAVPAPSHPGTIFT